MLHIVINESIKEWPQTGKYGAQRTGKFDQHPSICLVKAVAIVSDLRTAGVPEATTA